MWRALMLGQRQLIEHTYIMSHKLTKITKTRCHDMSERIIHYKSEIESITIGLNWKELSLSQSLSKTTRGMK